MNIFKLTILSTLVACGSFSPTEGEWQATNFDLSADACMLAATYGITGSDDSLSLTLAVTDDGFTSAIGNATPAPCTLDGMNYECTLQPLVFDFNDGFEVEDGDDLPAFDAVATFATTLTGTFTDANTATGTTGAEGSCEGDQCDGVIAAIGAQLGTDYEMPCTSAVSFDLSAASE
ncbi:MAG: hypothetical protein VX278_22355 [Myxococcota bacterium]|nr:hypothetical protein [Myxococcota bacterium]